MKFVSSLVALAGAAAVTTENLQHAESILVRVPIPFDNSSFVEEKYDVWKSWQNGQGWDILATPAELTELKASFGEVEVLNGDIAASIKNTYQSSDNATAPDDFFDSFHDLDGLLAYYDDLAKEHPDLVTKVDSIGKSVNGLDIPAFHLKSASYSGAKKMYWEGQIHAREWISGITVAYQATELLKQHAAGQTEVLDNIEFVIVPVVNPDGFAFTWTNDRLWRKNRRVNAGSSCVGVDLNRNWDSHWSGPGASGSPCSETYYGTSGFSEPETKAASDYILKEGPFLVGIDFHSYGQILMRPYGWTLPAPRGEDPPNVEFLQQTVQDMADAVRGVHGMRYTPEPAAQLYVASGGADDWMFDGGACAQAVTIELRDTGRHGFVLPPNQIKPTGEEIWAAMQHLFKQALA